MPTLPAFMLPSPSGYSSDDPGGVVKTDVAGGPSRYTLDWNWGPQRFNVEYELTVSEFSTWSTFYHITTKKGSIAFDMQLDSGFGLSTHSCHIVPGSYSASRLSGGGFSVSFIVETISQAYNWTLEEATAFVSIYDTSSDDVGTLISRIAQFANVDTLVL
jgi:hypothetical protein